MKLRSRRLTGATLLALCAVLPNMACAECMAALYAVSGKAVDAKGRPLTGTITFSWEEEYNGRTVQETTKARKGRYSARLGFYTQAKSVPGIPVPGGALYACTATLKAVRYSYPSAAGQQASGSIALSGFDTQADLPHAALPAAPQR